MSHNDNCEKNIPCGDDNCILDTHLCTCKTKAREKTDCELDAEGGASIVMDSQQEEVDWEEEFDEINWEGMRKVSSEGYVHNLIKKFFRTAIETAIKKEEARARDSERNRLYAVMRRLGVDVHAVIQLRKKWDKLAEENIINTPQ
jgi:hypothetical protein